MNIAQTDKLMHTHQFVVSDSANKLAGLHLWYIDRGILSVALTIVTDSPKPAENYRALLQELPEIKH